MNPESDVVKNEEKIWSKIVAGNFFECFLSLAVRNKCVYHVIVGVIYYEFELLSRRRNAYPVLLLWIKRELINIILGCNSQTFLSKILKIFVTFRFVCLGEYRSFTINNKIVLINLLWYLLFLNDWTFNNLDIWRLKVRTILRIRLEKFGESHPFKAGHRQNCL